MDPVHNIAAAGKGMYDLATQNTGATGFANNSPEQRAQQLEAARQRASAQGNGRFTGQGGRSGGAGAGGSWGAPEVPNPTPPAAGLPEELHHIEPEEAPAQKPPTLQNSPAPTQVQRPNPAPLTQKPPTLQNSPAPTQVQRPNPAPLTQKPMTPPKTTATQPARNYVPPSHPAFSQPKEAHQRLCQ